MQSGLPPFLLIRVSPSNVRTSEQASLLIVRPLSGAFKIKEHGHTAMLVTRKNDPQDLNMKQMYGENGQTSSVEIKPPVLDLFYNFLHNIHN